ARHDAVGAEPVTAYLHAHVCLERRRPHARIAHRIVALEAVFDLEARRLVAGEAKGKLRPGPLSDLVDQFGQLAELAGAADDVNVRGATEDLLLILLGHAAEHAEDLVGVAPLVPAQPAEGAVDLFLGMLADGASVEEDDIG